MNEGIEPQRTCVICRKGASKRSLLRVVSSKNGQIVVDMTDKMRIQGRGAYVCREESCFKKAIDNKAFQRSLIRKKKI